MDFQRQIKFRKLKVLFQNAYWPFALIYSYLASLSIYFLTNNGFSLDDYIASGSLGSSHIFIAYMIIAMAICIYIFFKRKSELIKHSHILLILILLIIFSYNFINNGLIEQYISIFLLSLSFSIFIFLAFGRCVSHKVISKPRLLIIIPIAFAVIFALISCLRMYSLHSHAYDMGIFVQAFYKFSRFDFDNTIRKIPHLWGDHFHPILLPLSFLFYIFPSPYLPLLLQASIVALGFLPVYLIAINKLKSSSASLLLSSAYLFFIGIGKAIEFDFHEITIAITAYLFVFYFYMVKKKFWYWVFLVLLLCFKEDLSIFVCALGLFIILTSKKDRLLGIATAGVGLLWFVVVTKLVIPTLSSEGFVYFTYNSLGDSMLDVLRGIVISPLHALHVLINHPLKMQTVFSMLGSFSYLLFLSPAFFLLAIPMMGESLWNDSISRWSGFHYEAIVAPVLIISAIYAISRILPVVEKKYQERLLSFVVILVLICSVTMSLYQSNPIFGIIKPSFYAVSDEARDLHRVIRVVSKNGSVTAQHSVVPLLAARNQIYEYPGCVLRDCAESQFFVLSLAGSTWPLEKSAMRDEIFKFLNKDGFRAKYGLYAREGSAFVFMKDYQAKAQDVGLAKEFLNQYKITEQ